MQFCNRAVFYLPARQRAVGRDLLSLTPGGAGAIKAAASMGAYAASKAGVARLTGALAEELEAHDITVNAVLPSITDTPANRRRCTTSSY